MTRLTVAANREGLQVGVVRRGQRTIRCAMAVGAVGKMRGSIDQRVRMTGCTVIGSCCRHQV